MKRSYSVLFAMAALVACGGSESGTADSAAAAPAAPNVVTFTARDFAFTAPDTIPAGVTTFKLIVEGTNLHHAQLLKFSEGKRLADFIAAMQAFKPGDAPPTWAVEVGGPNPPAPGEETNTTQMLEPGNYAVVCFVDIPDKVPHIMKGMAKEFVVVPSTATAVEPTPDVTVTLADFTFAVSTPLTAGQHTIRVDNSGPQPHEISILQFLPGKTMIDFQKWAEKFEGPPPVKSLGGVAGIQSGGHAFFTVNLTPGDYALFCFIPDAKDMQPHFMHGMVQAFKIG